VLIENESDVWADCVQRSLSVRRRTKCKQLNWDRTVSRPRLLLWSLHVRNATRNTGANWTALTLNLLAVDWIWGCPPICLHFVGDLPTNHTASLSTPSSQFHVLVELTIHEPLQEAVQTESTCFSHSTLKNHGIATSSYDQGSSQERRIRAGLANQPSLENSSQAKNQNHTFGFTGQHG